jgi:homoserine kinase
MADLLSTSVRVAAPATSANLGPGFDTFALALELRDVVEAQVATGGLQLEVAGEGSADLPRDETHLVATATRAALDSVGARQPGLRLRCRNVIPQGRGLGSSAAAIVTGIRLADALLGGGAFSDDGALALATALEGHPDNVAACLLGSFTLARIEPEGPRAVRLEVHPDIHAALFIPPFELSTALARGLLPPEVSHGAASANAARAALLVAALTARPDLLHAATGDALHQDFRRPAMPGTLALVDALRSAGEAACVSGAGPTVLALTTSRDSAHLRGWAPVDWAYATIDVAAEGAVTG